jgi:hypothetical protein
MDTRTTLRELDELITRAEHAIESEMALLFALPPSRLRSEKGRRVRSMRAQLLRLRRRRSSMCARAMMHTKIV